MSVPQNSIENAAEQASHDDFGVVIFTALAPINHPGSSKVSKTLS